MKADFSHDILVSALKKGDKKAFEHIYDQMSEALYGYVYKRVKNREISEGIVQEVFMSLWSKRDELNITTTVKSYLYGMAKFQVLNYMRGEKVRQKYFDNLSAFVLTQSSNPTEELLQLKDLKFLIEQSISQLPDKCQQAFRLSRYEHLSIKEIAEQMEISTRTVENYLTKALKHLRSDIGGLSAYTVVELLVKLL